ncbi:phage tail protein [Nocardia sp. 852002-20019_SCH5090214]|nr:phage tail protein [Nocardia sp. 852002-20019_SCH5090214]
MNPLLLSESTKTVVWDINSRVWHLHGAGAGREGVWLTAQTGHMFAPVSLITSEGARQDGATFLRSLRSKKDWDAIVFIKGGTVAEMRAIHDAWWRGWSTDVPCTVGTYTKHQGWRYCRYQLDGAPTPVEAFDPALNAAVSYQLSATAMDPLSAHLGESNVWINEDGRNEGTVRVRNAADQPAWPRYTMNGPGQYWIQDPTDPAALRVVETPPIEDGETLRIDTHPRHRTARVYSDDNPSGRNVWGALAGRRWFASMPAWSSTDIVVRVDGGNTASSVRVDVSPRSSRPF